MSSRGKSKEFMATNKGKVKVVSVKSVRKEGSQPPAEKVEEVSAEERMEHGYRLKEVRSLFLQCLAGVYLIAFLSVYLQAEGLYGSNGVTPVKAQLKLTSRNPQQCMQKETSLLCLVPNFFGIDSQHALELVAIVGVVVAATASMCAHVCTFPVLLILWGLYFSIYQVGGVFLHFQWDILLLETGALGVLIAPWLPTKSGMGNKPRDLITMWMVKWLLFRLMFASGIVKLQSGCPTWWGLTAMNYHFESQCIPTPFAYFAHHLPTWLLHCMVVGTYYIEIAIPIAFFAPFRIVRRFAFWSQIIFQLAIIVTGNYTFFNILTMVLCIGLLDAEFFGHKLPPLEGFSTSRLFSRALSYSFIGLSLFYTYKFFGLKYNSTDHTISSKITFSRVEFDWFVSITVPYATMMALVTFGSTVSQAIIVSLFDLPGCWKKFSSFISCVFYAAVCFGLFSVTLVPFTTLHKETSRNLYPIVQDLHTQLGKYHIANSYGLFRHMTGVEKGRPELILEYSDNVDGPWKEYHFMYKPGNVSAAPVFVAPHQPRLDWQMWFAALGNYNENPWLISLTYRLLQGEKSVVKLLDSTKSPSTTPKYIRGSLYSYHYTKRSGTTSDWWQRKREGEYMPAFSKDQAQLVDFIKSIGGLDQDVKTQEGGTYISQTLDSIRGFMDGNRPEYIIWGAVVALLVIIFTSKLL